MVVGEVPARSTADLEIIFTTSTTNEAFHVQVDLKHDVILRWGMFGNATQFPHGELFEGTTIDYNEPFMIRLCQNLDQLSCFFAVICRIECDIDGWILKVNNEISYDTYYHIEDLNIEDIQSVKIMGDVAISYTGFGSKGNMFQSW